MSCITVAKRPCYIILKIKPIYTIVHHYAAAMNAVLGIIADGGRAIIVIDREGVEINCFSFSLLILIKPFDGGLV